MTPARARLLLLCVTVLSLLHGCVGAGVTEPAGGLVWTSSGGEAAAQVAIYLALGVFLAAAFALAGVADLLCLPFAAAGHIDYFFLCRGLFDLL